MITIDEIKKYYPSDLHKFNRGLLREYLQYLILSIIFSHKLGTKLSFLGGTCLRLIYGLKRFSEDLDFDNKNLTESDFDMLSRFIASELEKHGLIVEINIIHKNAMHCKIRFPKLLKINNLSGIEEEKILIQVDTFDQGVSYQTETYILNKFDITKPIIVTPKEVILSQKLWTITNRKRAKGRDFYDIIFLLQNTKPNYDFLIKKFNADKLSDVKKLIQNHIENFDFELIAQDVKPFLLNNDDLDKIRYFKQLFEQVNLDG